MLCGGLGIGPNGTGSGCGVIGIVVSLLLAGLLLLNCVIRCESVGRNEMNCSGGCGRGCCGRW